MNREQYLAAVEVIKKDRKSLDQKQAQLREEYIESSKPCNVDDRVRVIVANVK